MRRIPTRFIYIFVLCLLACTLAFRIGSAYDLLNSWNEVKFDPLDGLELRAGTNIVQRASERARSVGLHEGDRVISVNGRPLRGLKDLHFRDAQPGAATLTILHRSGRPEDVRVPPNPNPPQLSTLSRSLVNIIMLLAVPWICLILGYWAVLVRPRDSQAWLLLLLMLSFPHLVFSSQWHWPDGWRQLGIGYHQIFSGLVPAALVLFGIYFAERLYLDRRYPWVKYVLLAPSLAAMVFNTVFAIGGAENLKFTEPLAESRRLMTTVSFASNFGAFGLFFSAIGMKWGTTKSADVKRRLRLLMWGTQVACAPLCVLFVVSFAIGKPMHELLPWSVLVFALLMMFLFPLTITYVIIVHRALDVRVVLRQGIQYALVRGGAVLFGVILSTTVLLGSILYALNSDVNRPQKVLIIVLGFVAVLLLQRLRQRLAYWIDRRFFREAYDAERVLSDLSEQVRTIVDPNSLLRTVSERISETLYVPRVAFFLPAGGPFRAAYSLGYDSRLEVAFPPEGGTVRHIGEHTAPAQVYLDDEQSWLYQDPRMSAEEREWLLQLESQLLLPLAVKDKLLGFLSLGQKKSEEPFSGSDIRLLSSVAAQTGLALENSQLTAEIATEAAKRERMNREIEIAREVQERLFPQKLPRIDGLDCAGGCRPALGVGGDYYDFLALPGGRLGVVIGDVSGKGIAAALLMASLQASVRGQSLRGETDLALLMSNVNSLIYEASTSSRYATLFYAELDPATRRLDYVNAGHNPPLLVRGDTSIHLEAGGTVVGLLPRFPYQQGTISLQPGDVLVAFTDGISEAMNSADEEWGEEELLKAIRACQQLPAQEMIPVLLRNADAFVNGAPQHDDMTLVIVKLG
ncbi:MAG TPA: SpoIIE family protein phosphatase [Bryobacteraceae bacterium]|nr:SpoIIE family protein phosphatase [Bryobacteraceae bacterium]